VASEERDEMSQPATNQRGEPRYRYEASVKFVLAADGLDEAYRMQQQIVGIVARHTNELVTKIVGSMLDLKHRPDLDGSLTPSGDSGRA
jgi:hypothetical protein